jgi:hypothetical protein
MAREPESLASKLDAALRADLEAVTRRAAGFPIPKPGTDRGRSVTKRASAGPFPVRPGKLAPALARERASVARTAPPPDLTAAIEALEKLARDGIRVEVTVNPNPSLTDFWRITLEALCMALIST